MSAPSAQTVTVTTNNSGALKECPAYVFGDPATQKIGLVVVQEWWGVNEQIRDEAADIASRGNFAAIVPDLYRGKVAIDREEAGHYMGELNWVAAVEDVRACAAYLKSRGCSKVGVTGFCMGGALSIASAAHGAVDAAAPFYGIPSDQLCDVGKIAVPLQLNFGSKDDIVGFSSIADLDRLCTKLDSAGVAYERNVYDAAHAFTNAKSPNYKPDIANEALTRMVKFMQAKLQ